MGASRLAALAESRQALAVPHCTTCDRFYNPNTLRPDGTCPTCGDQLGEPLERVEHAGSPWHFKLLVAITVVYLGWRFVQMATALLT